MAFGKCFKLTTDDTSHWQRFAKFKNTKDHLQSHI